MRQHPARTRSLRPLVALCVPITLGFGRHIARGFMQYVNRVSHWRTMVQHEYDNQTLSEMDGLAGMVLISQSEDMPGITTKLPFPVVNASARRGHDLLPTVCVDDLKIGQRIADYLLQRGYQRFAFLGDNRPDQSYRLRLQGMRDILTPHGHEVIELDHRTILGGPYWEKTREQLAGMATPMAIFGYNDFCARLAAQCCEEAGLIVPEQVGIIGCDNDELNCEMANPPLSSLDVLSSQVGYESAALLDRLLQGETLIGYRKLIAPGQVIERRSTSVFAVEDRRLAEAMNFMHTHACDPAHVVDVVKALNLPRRWLERAFSRELNTTPHQYLNQIRLDRAAIMLRETRLTVPDIAERCGFGYEPNLRRAFQAKFEQTPAKYRASFAYH